jgi:hypothetical protein
MRGGGVPLGPRIGSGSDGGSGVAGEDVDCLSFFDEKGYVFLIKRLMLLERLFDGAEPGFWGFFGCISNVSRKRAVALLRFKGRRGRLKRMHTDCEG